MLALCIALTTGCARVYLTVAPTSISSDHILRKDDVNGVSTWAILPESYNAQKANPWIIYNHGLGQTINSITADFPQSEFVQSLAAAGFVVIASEYRNTACWGNMDCVDDVANLQMLWRSELNLWSQPFVIGESMGGIVTWNAIAKGVLKPLAVVGIYPACNLANMYSRKAFAPTIQTAYGFTSRSGYSAATKGFDPMLDPLRNSRTLNSDLGIPFRYSCCSRNDPFANAIGLWWKSTLIHLGNRQPGNFDTSAVISFFYAPAVDECPVHLSHRGIQVTEARTSGPLVAAAGAQLPESSPRPGGILYFSMTTSRLRDFVWLLRHSHYSPEFGWYSPTPDGSRVARRKFLRESSFDCLITPTNLRIPLEGRDDIDTTVDIFYGHHYEGMERNILPGSIVWDIGANIGVTSLIFAQHHDVAHIFAYEPMPHTFECADVPRRVTDLAAKITLEPWAW